MSEVASVMYAAAGLSLAMTIAYLVKYSVVVRTLLGLPQVDDCTSSPSSSVLEPEQLNDSGCHGRPSTASAATQTTTDPDNQPPSYPSIEALKPADPITELPPLRTVYEPSCSSRCCEVHSQESAKKMLEQQVDKLRQEVERCKQLIGRIEGENRELRERLARQAQAQLTKGPSKFEDLSLGPNRPSNLITIYSNIYTDSRIDAWDALDLLPDVIEDDCKEKLLFFIVVLCFRRAELSLDDRLATVKQTLVSSAGLRTDNGLDVDGDLQVEAFRRDIEDSVKLYFRRSVSRYDISSDFQTVMSEVLSKLVDYESLKDCESLLKYVEQCLRVAWALTVQDPAYAIEYDNDVFSADKHTRFHTSDSDSNHIHSFLWPALVETPSGFCVSKGVVVTQDI